MSEIDTAAVRREHFQSPHGDCHKCGSLHPLPCDAWLLCDALDATRRWKAEALIVLNGWESVWRELGEPGPLGASKWEAARAEIARLTAIRYDAQQIIEKAEAQVATVREAVADALREAATGLEPGTWAREHVFRCADEADPA